MGKSIDKSHACGWDKQKQDSKVLGSSMSQSHRPFDSFDSLGKALFQITPLGCSGCGKQIEDKLLKQSGVISAKVFPRLGRILMEFDEIKTSAEHLEDMIGSWSWVHDVELKKVKRGYEDA